VLASGDQVEVITSRTQSPKEDWLGYVVTASARSKIRHALRESERSTAEEGKERLRKWMRREGIDFIAANIEQLTKRLKQDSPHELYYRVATDRIDLDRLPSFRADKGRIEWERTELPAPAPEPAPAPAALPGKGDTLLIGEGLQQLDYSLATCCNPIPGDEVFGFVTVTGGIKIHRRSCPNATNMMSKYAYRVMKAQWASKAATQFEVTLAFTGFDDVGLVSAITHVISEDMRVNMRAISFESKDGTFFGRAVVLVHDTVHLAELQEKLRSVPGVLTVDRAVEA
jgi:GTP pyrophosphokinase